MTSIRSILAEDQKSYIRRLRIYNPKSIIRAFLRLKHPITAQNKQYIGPNTSSSFDRFPSIPYCWPHYYESNAAYQQRIRQVEGWPMY